MHAMINIKSLLCAMLLSLVTLGGFAQNPDQMRVWSSDGSSSVYRVDDVDSITFDKGEYAEELGDWTIPRFIGDTAQLMLTEEERAYVHFSNEFAKKCFSKICSTPTMGKPGEQNHFFSPMALQMALAMCANGASEGAKEEILSALGFSGEHALENMNLYYNKIYNYLITNKDSVELAFPSALWVREGLPVKKDFVDVATKNYYATVGHLDFSYDSLSLTSLINDWAKEVTQWRVGNLDADIPSDCSLMLNVTDLVSGRWAGAFLASNSIGDFVSQNGESKRITYAKNTACLCRLSKTDRYQVLSYPFVTYDYNGDSFVEIYFSPNVYNDSIQRFSVAFLIPNEGEDLDDVLADVQWESIPFEWKTSVLGVPFFSYISQTYEWRDCLKELGIRKLFEEPFSSVDGVLSSCRQDGRIDIFNTGVNASIVSPQYVHGTGPGWGTGASVSVLLSRPYVFAVMDNSTGLLLSMGRINGFPK